jgi:hypothetical protein
MLHEQVRDGKKREKVLEMMQAPNCACATKSNGTAQAANKRAKSRSASLIVQFANGRRLCSRRLGR